MPKLPRISGRELIKILEVFGFVVIRQKGSHIVLKKKTPLGETGTVVPDHKELAKTYPFNFTLRPAEQRM